MKLDEEHMRLIKEFGSEPISKIKDTPNYRAFETGAIFSQRDFGDFMEALKAGKKCAIVSGFNPSNTMHFGHLAVFQTNLFFQKEYGVDIYVPLSDDESYVTRKISDQKVALEKAKEIAKEMVALGFDPKKTFFVIDQVYTEIYNLAIKYSRQVTLSMAKATYGFTDDNNIGLIFYPSIQAAHVTLPLFLGYEHVLVPISIDEDAHLRIARDIAAKFGVKKPAVIHSIFMPGLDGLKMSKSKPHEALFLKDNPTVAKKKIMKAFSGGGATLEEHKKHGGNPNVDVSFIYLDNYFLNRKESKKIADNYKSGKMLSGEMKKLLAEKVESFLIDFQLKLKKLKDSDIEKMLLTNKTKIKLDKFK